jgi:hypothetical protein
MEFEAPWKEFLGPLRIALFDSTVEEEERLKNVKSAFARA